MNRRRTALAAIGALGAGATYSYLRHSPTLEAPLPGDDHTYRWRGMDVAYTTAGDPENRDVVFFHGIHAAGSSVEFRAMWPHLTDHYHVIAPDLPGFGRSDRPPITYDPALYEAFITDFTDDVTTTPVGVATSLTGAYAAAVADAFEELVLVCPTDTTTSDTAWLGDLLRTRGVGALLFAALTAPPSLRWWMANEAYDNPANLTPELVAYLHDTTRQPGARYAPAAFVAGDLDPTHRLVDTLAASTVPTTLVWGREAARTPLALGESLADTTGAALVVVDDAKLLPHSEHPKTVLSGLAAAGVIPGVTTPDPGT